MNRGFPMVPLEQVIRPRKEFIQIVDLKTYKRCRVQLHAKGIVLRDVVTGSEIKTKEQQVCRAGEFLVAEIDAKVGGFGLVFIVGSSIFLSAHQLFRNRSSPKDRPTMRRFALAMCLLNLA